MRKLAAIMIGLCAGFALVSLGFAAGAQQQALLPVTDLATAARSIPPANPARTTLPGPVKADVIRVVDGDTLVVRATVWIGQTVETSVRIDGIDTPEIRGACASERAAAQDARTALQKMSAQGVLLSDIRVDKYGGRVIARVTGQQGDIAQWMITNGHARPYAGKTRAGWCAKS